MREPQTKEKTAERRPRKAHPASPARVEAVRLLDLFHRKWRPLSLILSDHRWRVESRDRILASELLYGTIRWEIQLDWLLSQFVHGRLGDYPITVQNILRLGAYQIEHLRSIPDYAVVNEAVELARAFGQIRFARLVNAVLRNFLRRRKLIQWPATEAGAAEALGVRYAFQPWMVQLFLDQYGFALTEKVLASLNERPVFSLRINTKRRTPEEFVQVLGEQGIEAEPSPVLPEFVRIRGTLGPVWGLPGFSEGEFFVQDESAGIVAHLAEPQGPFIDVCSAPGGKLSHIRQLLGDDLFLIASDLHASRLELVKDNFRRLRLKPPAFVQADGRRLPFRRGEQFLLDVPCSGLGVIRKNPDIKLRRTPEEISELVEIQKNLLEEAAKLLPPGGVIIYSTCTINREENQGVVEKFLSGHRDFSPVAISGWEEIRQPGSPWLEILPVGTPLDGAFVAKVRKRSV